MTYHELSAKYNEAQLPHTNVNDHGELETIFHTIDTLTYNDITWERPCFRIVTKLNNGYIRHQYFFKDGATEEFYEIPR